MHARLLLLFLCLAGLPALAGAPQTISFPVIPDKLSTAAPFSLAATASSGLPVSYSILSPAGTATVTNGVVSLSGTAGPVTVRASQAGNGTYDPAPDALRTFTVGAAGQRFVKLSRGSHARHSAGIRVDGTLWAWGENPWGQVGDGSADNHSIPVQVGGAGPWADVACGSYHTVAVRADGTLWAWGNNQYGQLGDGSTDQRSSPVQVGTATNWASVACGEQHSMAVRADGTLWAWGHNASGKLGDGTTTSRSSPVQVAGGGWASVACGDNHTVATKTDGTLWTWGMNFYGQLGDGTTTSRATPAQVGSQNDWTSAACGAVHTLAVKSSGTLWAWGLNSWGQLGDGSTTDRTSPVQVGIAHTWASVSCGPYNALAVTSTGSLWAWGGNDAGQYGDGTLTRSASPVPAAGGGAWAAVSCGQLHTLALKADGTLWAWGDNGPGRLGSGLANRPAQVQAGSPPAWASVASAGFFSSGHVIGLKKDGTLWAWGGNYHGQIGNDTIISRGTPVPIAGTSTWTSVAAGTYHTAAVRSDGTLWTWGSNVSGQLGDDSGAYRYLPAQVGNDASWASVACGSNHTMAVKTDGTLWAWGANYSGQLGDGSTQERHAPVQVGGTGGWAFIACGSEHTVAVKTDGTLWAWGANSFGQLGVGGTTNSGAPVQVGSANGWASVSCGQNHTVAVKTNGTLFAWGANFVGELGDGTTTQRDIPVQVGGASGWSMAAAGVYHTLAVKTDGTLWAWGANFSGQLGDGGILQMETPVQVGSAGHWTSVACGQFHSHAVRADGTLWAWGGNEMGQLGLAGAWMPERVWPSRAFQMVTFPAPAALQIGQAVVVNASATSGLPPTFTAAGPATLAGNVVTATGPGIVVLSAYQAGDGVWQGAVPVVQSIIVTALPIISTGAASSVTPTTATLNGGANPNGAATNVWFEYGPTTSYGSSTSPQAIGAGGSQVPVTANLTGLLPGSPYHFRLVAQNTVGTVQGDSMSFATPGVPEIRVFAGADTGAPELTDGQTSALNFGSTPLGTRAGQNFTIKNAGSAPLEVTAMAVPEGYAHSLGFSPFTLEPGATHTIEVLFLSNTAHGTFPGTLSISSNDAGEAVFDFPVTATAVNGVNAATLDATLAGTGLVSTAFQHGGALGQDVAVQSDGKIVVAGYASNGTNLDFAVARYLPDGGLDPAFGTGGLALMDIDGADDWGRAVAVQSDGRIVVAGTCDNGSNDDFAIARFMPDGSPDNSFDANAKKRTPIGDGNDRGWSVAIQSDGKIVVAGEAYYSPYWRFAVVRYTTAGAHDTTFSSDGLVTATVGSDDANVRSMALQADGKIVVGGYYMTTSNSSDFALVRFTTSGALDTTFSSDGRAVGTIGSGVDRGYSVHIQSDGKILLAGESHNGTNLDFAVARFTTTGAWDTSFSGDGRLTTAIGGGDDRGRAVRVMGDGSIVVAGYCAGTFGSVFALARYTAAGELDPAFGSGGTATQGFPSSAGCRGYALALDADGNLIVAGDRDLGTTTEFALARFGGSLTPDVITMSPSALATTSAVLQGSLNPNGVLTHAWFEYGPTPALGSATPPQAAGDGTVSSLFSTPLNGLAQGVTYHYRLVAQNGETTVVGVTQSFTTLDPEIRVFAGANDAAPELTNGQAAPVDFGSTPLGTPRTQSFTVKNVGTSPLILSGLSLPSSFEYALGFFPVLEPGTWTTFQVRFLAHTVKGPFGGTFRLSTNDLDEPFFEFPLVARAVTHQPHVLDVSFSGDGIQTTPVGELALGNDIAVQPDGKIVVVGMIRIAPVEDIIVMRCLPNGDLDAGFGTGGLVITDFTASDRGEAVALQTDGKIVIGGGNGSDFVLARYEPDGQLDSSFGTGGKVVANIASDSYDLVEDVLIQPDGKIVAVGTTEPSSSSPNVAVARFTHTGALDTTFSGDGKLTTDIGGSNDYGNAAALQPDGRLVVAAYSYTGANGYRMAALRYLANGTLDTTFSGDGKVVLTLGGETYAHAKAVRICPDGGIILGGYATISSVNHFALVKLTSAGGLDTTFGTGGKVVHSFDADNRLADLVILGDGRIIAGGHVQASGGNPRFALARYSGAGVLDTSFGAGGIASDMLANGWGAGMALQADEKIVMVGSNPSYSQVMVARFGADIRPLIGAASTSETTPNSAVINSVVYPNGVITHAWLEYGTSTAYGSTTPPQAAGYGTLAKQLTTSLSGLASGTTYHYRVVAQNGETTVRGADRTFTTEASPLQKFTVAMTAAGLTGPDAAVDAMPHDDGVSNLAKYAFNMNLGGPHAATMTAGGTAGLPAITRPAPGGIFRFEFLRRKNSGLTYLPLKSAALTAPSWQPLTAEPTVTAIDSTWERVIYEEPYDSGQTTRLFGRVQVTLDP